MHIPSQAPWQFLSWNTTAAVQQLLVDKERGIAVLQFMISRTLCPQGRRSLKALLQRFCTVSSHAIQTFDFGETVEVFIRFGARYDAPKLTPLTFVASLQLPLWW
jgi:hypothetical protein